MNLVPVYGERRKSALRELDDWVEIHEQQLDGVLAMAFSSRSGSTFISREIENRFQVSRMRETFTPSRLNVDGLNIPRGWFAFKSGVRGFVVAEKLKFFENYLDKTHFLFLYRRDIVAQAVSVVKAKQQGIWHSTDTRTPKPAEYDPEMLSKTIRIITDAMQTLRAFLLRTERPFAPIFYEDCISDFSAVEVACDKFGIPRRGGVKSISKPVSKVGNSLNQEWISTYKANVPAEVQPIIARYQRLMKQSSSLSLV